MFSGSGPVRTEPPAPCPRYDRRPSYSAEQQRAYDTTPRPTYEPPRALEPRPNLHTSLSDTVSLHRRQESYRPIANPPDHRQQGPSLPGVRDLLTPAPTSSASPSYGHSWYPPQSQPAPPRAQYASSYVHPPMVLEPHAQAAQDTRPRSWEVPMHVAGAETSQPPQSVPLTPYAYQHDYRHTPDNRYERPAASSAGAHLASGMPSPYSAVPPDGSPFGGPISAYDRAQHLATPTSNAEAQKKYLGVQDVPGEGTFHLYEGGHRIPTHVDGEHVNPAWGLTKANKPRKRLALACLDCREKKIKCEPGATSCLQCEKAKRPCRRSQAQSQAESASSADWSPTHSRNKASVSDPTPAPTREIEPDTLSKRRSREDPSPPSVPTKKHRSASPLPAIIRDAPMPSRELPGGNDTEKPVPEPSRGGMLCWEDDPYAVDPEVTLQLLKLYFGHFNNATYCLYPEHHFMQWLRNSPDKCQNERMVLYAILAVASLFADASLFGFGNQCAHIAMDILPRRPGVINMCTAQARILLAIYCFSKGEYNAAWEHSGSAIRAVEHLRCHTEEGCLDDSALADQPRVEFKFSVAQYIECKRRTFWSAFFMDRYCQPTVTMLKPQDIFVRLPCLEEMYEKGLPSDAPYYPNEIIDPIKSSFTPASTLSNMGWHAHVAAIWGDVVDFTFRAPYQHSQNYRATYDAFYTKTWNNLQGWLTRLPGHLQYSTGNFERSIQGGYAGTFISMHALYHLCCIKLNRCLRHSLAQDYVARNIRAAHAHAHELLQLMCAVSAARRHIEHPEEGQASTFAFTTPFTGYAILAAIDVVSAGGPENALGTTLEEISGALACLRELSTFWSSARDQARLCERRFYQIQNILKNPGRAKGGAWLGKNWGTEKPLEPALSADDDCIYGLGGHTEAMELYFDAFREGQGHASKAPLGGVRIG